MIKADLIQKEEIIKKEISQSPYIPTLEQMSPYNCYAPKEHIKVAKLL